MTRYRTESEDRCWGLAFSLGPNKVLSIDLGQRQYVWDFSSTFDWDGYDQMVGGKWLTPEEAEC